MIRKAVYICYEIFRIMPEHQIKPTDSELEILQIIWKRGPSTVRQIHDILSAKKDAGYTTTLKLLQIMVQKGIVTADKSFRTHIYYAILKEEETQKKLIDQLLSMAFGGSASKLVMSALGNAKPRPEEIEELRNFIKDWEDKNT
jgi:BlaI family penicillinase repressor